jgi:hypothetical protein
MRTKNDATYPSHDRYAPNAVTSTLFQHPRSRHDVRIPLPLPTLFLCDSTQEECAASLSEKRWLFLRKSRRLHSIAGSSPSSRLQTAPSPVNDAGYDGADDCIVESCSAGSSSPARPSSLPEAPPSSPVDDRSNCSWPDILNESISGERSGDSSIIGVETDAAYPPEARDFTAADATGSSEDLDYFFSSWMPPTPNNLRPIAEDILISPVEESLLCLLTENNLPKRCFASIMEWGHHASFLDYDFSASPTYQTILGRMLKKYSNVSGGPPLSEVVHVPNHAPMLR